MAGKDPRGPGAVRFATVGAVLAWLAAVACCVWIATTQADSPEGVTVTETAWRALVVALAGALAATVVLGRAVAAYTAAPVATATPGHIAFERTRAPLLVIDPVNARIADTNSAAADFYGVERDALCGRSFHDLAADRVDLSIAHLAAAAEQCATFRLAQRLRDGEVRGVQVTTGPFEWAGRRYILAVIHDANPVRAADASRDPAERSIRALRGASGSAPRRRRVLLVEDDPQLRTIFTGVLASAGWEVVAAGDDLEGEALWRSLPGAIDALVTNGKPAGPADGLADLILAEQPTLPVVFVSAWTSEPPTLADGGPGTHRALLRKPFRPSRIVELLAGFFAGDPSTAGTTETSGNDRDGVREEGEGSR